MSWIGAAIGTGILGGGVGGYFSNKAAQTQAGAADRATESQERMFNQTRADLLPYQTAGTTALSDLQGRLPQLLKPFSMQDFQESPAYQFNLQQGKLALDKASAARSKFYAPSTLQDIAKFSQGLASNEFQNSFQNYQTNMGNIWNRLYSLAGTGQNAAARTGAFGTSVASDIAGNTMAKGNAQAAGQIGVGNAITGSINNMLPWLMYQGQRSTVPGSIPPMVDEQVPGQFSMGNPAYG